MTGLGLAVALAGCGAGDTNGGTGGSSSGTGGTHGSGGSGVGGMANSTGGTPGSGGSGSGTGGMGSGGSGSGGTSNDGGGTGTGGGSASGGKSGSDGGGTFTLTSPDQADNAKFGTMYTCAAMNGTFGSGVNPELDWAGVPAGTLSFAMTFIDTKLGDTSPMGQHWAMWDVPPSAMKFPKATMTLTGDLAGAKQTNKYLAPCPSGNDTYEFTLYALSTATLGVTGAEGTGTANSAGVAKVLTALKALTPLGTAKLHGTSGPMGK
jgi:phosphatidylethanolamine-binding protein (PEBP) family uncharacterized protein